MDSSTTRNGGDGARARAHPLDYPVSLDDTVVDLTRSSTPLVSESGPKGGGGRGGGGEARASAVDGGMSAEQRARLDAALAAVRETPGGHYFFGDECTALYFRFGEWGSDAVTAHLDGRSPETLDAVGSAPEILFGRAKHRVRVALADPLAFYLGSCEPGAEEIVDASLDALTRANAALRGAAPFPPAALDEIRGSLRKFARDHPLLALMPMVDNIFKNGTVSADKYRDTLPIGAFPTSIAWVLHRVEIHKIKSKEELLDELRAVHENAEKFAEVLQREKGIRVEPALRKQLQSISNRTREFGRRLDIVLPLAGDGAVASGGKADTMAIGHAHVHAPVEVDKDKLQQSRAGSAGGEAPAFSAPQAPLPAECPPKCPAPQEAAGAGADAGAARAASSPAKQAKVEDKAEPTHPEIQPPEVGLAVAQTQNKVESAVKPSVAAGAAAAMAAEKKPAVVAEAEPAAPMSKPAPVAAAAPRAPSHSLSPELARAPPLDPAAAPVHVPASAATTASVPKPTAPVPKLAPVAAAAPHAPSPSPSPELAPTLLLGAAVSAPVHVPAPAATTTSAPASTVNGTTAPAPSAASMPARPALTVGEQLKQLEDRYVGRQRAYEAAVQRAADKRAQLECVAREVQELDHVVLRERQAALTALQVIDKLKFAIEAVREASAQATALQQQMQE